MNRAFVRRAASCVLLLASASSGALAQEEWFRDWDSARRAAQAGRKPMVVEFQAVWCYSCYYMEKVLAGPAFAQAAQGMTLLKLDVDKPEGRALRDKYRARALPTFVIVDPAGKELGRIVGEQTQKDFLAQLSRAAGRPRDQGLERLQAALDRSDLAAASRERDRLRPGKAGASAEFRTLSARTELLLAAKDKKAAAAARAFADLLGLEEGCALAYDVEEAFGPLSALEAAPRRALLLDAAARLETLVEKRVLGPKEERCADARTAVASLCDVYEALGEKGKEDALEDRVLAMLRTEASKEGAGADRNLDDNLRFFLEKAGRQAELDELYPRLIAAYPADYVYAYRYSKNLLERKEYGRALPYAEKGVQLGYGANRLNAVSVKARILSGLGRKAEALQLLRSELKAARGRFQKEASGLEEALRAIR